MIFFEKQDHFSDTEEKYLWQVKNKFIDTRKGVVYGVLNVSPESFFDGQFVGDKDDIINHAKEMIADGADIVEVGGQSTKPGFQELSIEDEISRIEPIISILKTNFPDISLAVDSYKSEVIKESINVGVDVINDINGFTDKNNIEVIKDWDGGIVSMKNWRGLEVNKKDVWSHLNFFYTQMMKDLNAVQIKTTQIVLDPGVGFVDARDGEQDVEIMSQINNLSELNRPIMTAVDDKGWIKSKLNLELGNRRIASLSAQAYMYLHGAKVIRSHNVKATRQLIDTLN